ncbi:hypothetical protein K491DRAFT_723215 [Lophiostoma macrostomum CBS 122681]|uniref:RING-type domain-containing protein n=1 Tax=Lophiostoma macrostomum CBS 122681 TaxID=1314788 RepID=A0A6A6SIX4_9PLEO|nr:hypothetical protein K491DRAFT_723215 [Lophiostoma macrostomum CBS 122681]
MVPRKITLQRYFSHEGYNKVVRLEGQIAAAVEVIRFRNRWIWYDDGPQGSLAWARAQYLAAIDHLRLLFLHNDMDLAWGAVNPSSLEDMVGRNYYRVAPHIPGGSVRPPHHWKVISFYRRLQQTLEDDTQEIGESLVNGWHLFIDQNEWPVSSDPVTARTARIWHGMSSRDQEVCLRSLSVNGGMVRRWMNELKNVDLEHTPSAYAEARGLIVEMAKVAPERRFDTIWHPHLVDPSRQDFSDSDCPICYERLQKSDINGRANHRPVQTECRHVFGYSCLREWLGKHESCPMCRRDFSLSTLHAPSPENTLEGINRMLNNQRPRTMINPPSEPYSYLDDLAGIFGPTHAVKRNFSACRVNAEDFRAESERIRKNRIYLSWERLKAYLAGDRRRYREVVQTQAQLFARRTFLIFMAWWHPSWPL